MNIAHRGASGRAPEHTVAAFDLALHGGAQYIELDVHMSRDGVPVVFHDTTLARVARSLALVGSLTLAELRAYDVGRWFNETYPHRASNRYVGLRPVTLDEVLLRYRNCARFCIELKDPRAYPGVEERVLESLATAGLDGPAVRQWRAVILAADSGSLRKIHGMLPYLPLLQLFDNHTTGKEIRSRLDSVRELAFGFVAWKGSVDPALMDAARELELAVAPFTVNRLEEMARLLSLGVHGMITDYPDRMHELVRALALADRDASGL